VDVSGAPDLESFDRIVDFLVDAGVDGVCLGGATAEYPHFDVAERKLLIDRALPRLPATTKLLVGIGCPSPRRTVDLGRYAMDAGAHAVLLPMPLFFRYEQSDLRAYCSDVAAALGAPCLLYDLPDFTNPIETSTAIDLLRTERFIVGIKDSSGRPERIDQFVAARGSASWSLIVGDDRCLQEGLAAGWTGAISGVAGFCPELLVALHRACVAGDEAAARKYDALLSELIERMSVFPTPWAIRLGLAARGIDTGPLPLPLTAERRAQAETFTEWMKDWMNRIANP
jgi:4-hydroxy-tetrahydrodipicolinate synthase